MMLEERLKNAREAAGLTQEELAKLAGVRQSHISRIEAGSIKEIKTGTLTRLARALNVTTDYLLGLDDTESDTEPAALAIV